MNSSGSDQSAVQQKNIPVQNPDGRLPSCRPVYFSLLVIVFIFAAFEFLERGWLSGMERSKLHLLHIARGIFSSLLVGGVVAWQILKSSPSFLVAHPLAEQDSEQRRITEGERTRIYARWFIAMRWIAVIVSVLLIFITVRVFEVLPQEVWWPLVFTVAALGACNLVYGWFQQWEKGASAMLSAQGYLDLAILTALLHYSGGVENPLSTVMIFHVIIGGILLSRRQCYGLAAAGSVSFSLLIWTEYAGLLHHYTLSIFPHLIKGGQLLHAADEPVYAISRALLQTIILCLTAYFVTSLAERMRYNERRLEAMIDRALADRQLLERALETTGAGLRVIGRGGTPYWVSSRWRDWFVSPNGTDCPACETLDRPNSPALETLRDGLVRMTELSVPPDACPSSLLRGASQEHIFQITTAPLMDMSGKIVQAVELAQDITQQKITQTQMMRAGKLAAVGELAGQVAHEVNNPIAIISAKVKLLLSDGPGDLPPKYTRELQKIGDLATRVARVAQGLLSYCRPSVGSRVPLDLRVPVRKSLSMVEECARAKGVRLEDRLSGEPAVVTANAYEMEQVFLNLFLNALDAMPKGGWLQVSALGGRSLPDGSPAISIAVQDTGDGIPDAIRERIFEPFFTTKKEGKGTGLGLSICLGLIQSHGGKIELESRVWQGTRVIVKLPVCQPVFQEGPYGQD